MPLEPVTILVSALVGGAAGVLMSSWKVITEETTKRRVAARLTIRREATRLGVYLIALDTGQPTQEGFDPTSKDGIVAWTATILEASTEFGALRRRRIRERLKRIVGHYSVLFADAQSIVSFAEIAHSMRKVSTTKEFVVQVANYLDKPPNEITHNPADDVPGGLIKDALGPKRDIILEALHWELIWLRKAR